MAQAGCLYQKWQKSNQQILQRDQLLATIEKISAEIFRKKTTHPKHYFATAITHKGFIDIMDDLSKSYSVRYILRGEPGCGQDIILEKISDLATQHGYYAEIFHDTLQPQQINMLLIPELSAAILTENKKQDEIWRSQDHIISMHQFLAAAEDESPKEEEKDIQTCFKTLIEKASEKISEAKSLHDDVEYYYRKAMDFEQVDELSTKLLNRILALAAEKEK